MDASSDEAKPAHNKALDHALGKLFGMVPGLAPKCGLCKRDYAPMYDLSPSTDKDMQAHVSVQRSERAQVHKVHCAHTYCRPCLADWIKGRIDNVNEVIVCPNADCTNRRCSLHADDVERLVDKTTAREFIKSRVSPPAFIYILIVWPRS